MLKTKNVFIITLLFAFSIGSISALQAQKQGRKKRIAVFAFEDKSDSNWSWWGNKGVGEGMSDMVTTELVQTGDFTVIERDRLNELLQEQDLGASGIVTAQSAAQMGKNLGVELAVFGAVTEFGYKNSKTNVNVPRTGIRVGKQSAVAGVDIRIVNTSTGEILAAENIREQKSSLAGGVRVKRFNFDNQQAFDESLVGKVARKAIDKVVELISNNAEAVKWQAKVIMMKDGKVFINSGANDGVQVGEVFSVSRIGEKLIDPDTGISLGSTTDVIGKIKVVDTSVGDGKASICEVVDGSDFEKGDLVNESK